MDAGLLQALQKPLTLLGFGTLGVLLKWQPVVFGRVNGIFAFMGVIFEPSLRFSSIMALSISESCGSVMAFIFCGFAYSHSVVFFCGFVLWVTGLGKDHIQRNTLLVMFPGLGVLGSVLPFVLFAAPSLAPPATLIDVGAGLMKYFTVPVCVYIVEAATAAKGEVKSKSGLRDRMKAGYGLSRTIAWNYITDHGVLAVIAGFVIRFGAKASMSDLYSFGSAVQAIANTTVLLVFIVLGLKLKRPSWELLSVVSLLAVRSGYGLCLAAALSKAMDLSSDFTYFYAMCFNASVATQSVRYMVWVNGREDRLFFARCLKLLRKYHFEDSDFYEGLRANKFTCDDAAGELERLAYNNEEASEEIFKLLSLEDHSFDVHLATLMLTMSSSFFTPLLCTLLSTLPRSISGDRRFEAMLGGTLLVVGMAQLTWRGRCRSSLHASLQGLGGPELDQASQSDLVEILRGTGTQFFEADNLQDPTSDSESALKRCDGEATTPLSRLDWTPAQELGPSMQPRLTSVATPVLLGRAVPAADCWLEPLSPSCREK